MAIPTVVDISYPQAPYFIDMHSNTYGTGLSIHISNRSNTLSIDLASNHCSGKIPKIQGIDNGSLLLTR